jgi:hypothetical protein
VENEEHDVRVPLIGERGDESLDPAATEALVEAAEEAVRAESENPIDLDGPQHFSTRHFKVGKIELPAR